ncbi:unnamed protein product [Heligmosomoides polygyrus]|uniref:C2H2-type domain-containing protein n=1 Tax=Heligmosomoides polygyrus TaxID=6339 RepID=A0A183GAG8_HELPZ|nr:unnamed protein product [Heligmosomoides polygyrus]
MSKLFDTLGLLDTSALSLTSGVAIMITLSSIRITRTRGLMRALENGTEEVNRLLRHSCNIVLECRFCKSVFRSAKHFHNHKLTSCRVFHKRLTPSYKQVLVFQNKVAACHKDKPSTSHQFADEEEESDMELEVIEEPINFASGFDVVEESCEGLARNIEWTEFLDRTGSLITESQNVEYDDESTETDAISLSASPIPGAFLSFPLFNDQLLESPTDSDYFGKGEALTPSPVLVPVPQME